MGIWKDGSRGYRFRVVSAFSENHIDTVYNFRAASKELLKDAYRHASIVIAQHMAEIRQYQIAMARAKRRR